MSNQKEGIRNLTVLIGSTLTVIAATAISPVLPAMSEHFSDVPNAELLSRLALTMPALFIAMGAPLAGVLLDQWGRRPVLLVSLLLYAVAGSAGFVLESLPGILVSRALLGIAVAGIMSGYTTLILDYFSGVRLTQFLGYQSAFVGMGAMSGGLIAGLLGDIDWRLPFLIHAVALLLVPTTLYAVTEPDRASRVDASQQAGVITAPIVFPWRIVGLIFATAFISTAAFYVYPVQVPFYLSENGASNSQIGFALSMQALTSIITGFLYKRTKGRLSYQGIMALAFVLLCINHALLASNGAYVLAVIALSIGGLGVGYIPANNNAWLASVIPATVRGRAIGGLTSLTFLGQFFTPILSQPVVELAGIAGMFGVAAVMTFLLALLFGGMALQMRVEAQLPAASDAAR